MRVLRVFCSALAIAAFVTPAARADEWNKQTILTFSGPVQVPGATLPAGTYQFKLADLQGNRHVVQIFDKDGTKLYTTILAIPDERLEPTDKPVVLFTETPAGSPAAVKAWFYPGDPIGNEFVYPRREAMQIASTTHQPVLSRADESSEMKSAEVERVDENGNPVNANEHAKATESTKPAETTTATTTTTAGQSASPYGSQPANERPNADQNKPAVTGTTGTTTPATTATTGQANADQNPQSNAPSGRNARPARRDLPKTASPLALYELVSGLAFAGAYGLRRLRRSH